MVLTSVFDASSYKIYLNFRVQEKRGNLSELAKIAGCHPSYLSRVLSEEIHLTQDHAHRLCQHWQFETAEREYFLALVDWERAADPDLRKYLSQKISALKATHENLKNRMTRKDATEEQKSLVYHSSWTWAAIHFLTSIPGFHSVDSISKKLHLAPELVQSVLKRLHEQGLVDKKNQKYFYSSSTAHIDRGSPVLSLFHNNWRQQSVMDAQNPASAGIHFTNIQTISKKDLEEFKSRLTDLIQKFGTIGNKSDPETLAVMTFDLWNF